MADVVVDGPDGVLDLMRRLTQDATQPSSSAAVSERRRADDRDASVGFPALGDPSEVGLARGALERLARTQVEVHALVRRLHRDDPGTLAQHEEGVRYARWAPWRSLPHRARCPRSRCGSAASPRGPRATRRSGACAGACTCRPPSPPRQHTARRCLRQRPSTSTRRRRRDHFLSPSPARRTTGAALVSSCMTTLLYGTSVPS